MDFILKGRQLTLTAAQVSRRVRVPPEPVRQHWVRVNDTVYPVKQVFELATGIPRSEFTSQTARRHLAALGLELGEAAAPTRAVPPERAPLERQDATETLSSEWHTEERVQGAVVRFLVEQGWEIVSVANTGTREHGVDVLARRNAEQLAIEVKGFPSRNYADPARAGETKRTQPSTQAKHWFAQAVLTAMLTRSRRPEHRSVIALPDFKRYRDLCAEISRSLERIDIEVWWVEQNGRLEVVGS